jgi:hypothetical protein
VFFIREINSELKTLDFIDPVIYRCRKLLFECFLQYEAQYERDFNSNSRGDAFKIKLAK